MTADVWLSVDETLQITGWSTRTLRRKVQSREAQSRESSDTSRNGKQEREYALSSLPSDAKEKYLQSRAIVAASSQAIETIGDESALSPQLPIFGRVPALADPNRVILPKHLEQQANDRYRLIAPLLEFEERRKRNPHAPELRSFSAHVKWVAAQVGKTEITLWRLLKKYRSATGDPIAALADRVRCDKGQSRFFDGNPVLADYARKLYLVDGCSFRTVHETLERECQKRGLEIADYKTVRVYLKSIPKAVEVFARDGERKYHDRFEMHVVKRYDDKLPNDIWVSDHMKFDVWVKNDYFDEVPEWAALRLWLTAASDYRSRKIIGFTFCVNPSSATIAAALRQALITYGPPQISFYVDNGKDYKSLDRHDAFRPELDGALHKLGIETQHCKRRWPQSKNIERFFRTLHMQFDQQWRPFYCGTSPATRPDHCDKALKHHKRLLDRGHGADSPLPLASEFMQLAAYWITQRYNAQHDHTGEAMDGRTPDEVFDAGYPIDSRRTLSADQIRLLDFVFRKSEKRRVGKGGTVEIAKRRYEPADPRTEAALFPFMGYDVMIAFDPQNLDEAIVTDLDCRPLGIVRASKLMTHGPASKEEVAQLERRRATIRKEMTRAIGGLVAITEARGQKGPLDIMREEAGIQPRPRVQRRRALPAVAVPTVAAPKMGYDHVAEEFFKED